MVKTKPNYKNRIWLENQYITLKKSMREIGKECNVSDGIIYYYLRQFSIKIRTPSEARKGRNEYFRIHYTVRRLKQKPECCEDCGKKTSKLHLSFNRFHKYNNPIYYTENPNDYTYRCINCHRNYDKRIDSNRSISLKNFL